MCRRIFRIGLALFAAFIVLGIVVSLLPTPAALIATATARARLTPQASASPALTQTDEPLVTQPRADVKLPPTSVSTVAEATITQPRPDVKPALVTMVTNTTTVEPSGGTQAWYIELQTHPAASATITPMVVFSTATVAPSATPAPSTATPFTAQPVALSGTYYAQGLVNVRDCPQRSCTLLGSLTAGDAVEVDASVNGDAVTAQNGLWYRFNYNGHEGYVYAAYLTSSAPVISNQAQPSGATNAQPSVGQPAPHNCATAKAMGLNAQQAAQYPALDHDHDGVACYGS